MLEFITGKLSEPTGIEQKLLSGEITVNSDEFIDKDMLVVSDGKINVKNRDLIIDFQRHIRFCPVPPHKHNHIEMMYVLKGQIVHKIGNNTVIMDAGDLLLMNQHAVHSVLPSGAEDIAVNFIIQPKFFNSTYGLVERDTVLSTFLIELLSSSPNWNQYLHFKLKNHFPSHNLIELLLVGFSPFYDEQFKYGENIDDVTNRALMALLIRYLSRDMDTLSENAPTNYHEVILRTIYNYIDQDFQTATLAELSRILNQSDYSLSRQVKQLTGCTFKELLQRKRFQHAADLLEGTDLPVSDIVSSVGYENSSYFYRQFRERYGISPKDYRARKQQK